MNTNTIENSEPITRRFEIAVYDETINESTGKIDYRPVSFAQPVVLSAKSKAELNEQLSLYKQCGQIAKIIRELDPIVPKTNAVAKNTVEISPKTAKESTIVSKTPTASIRQTAEPVKYYKIGDVELKNDNGKLYQRQWLRVTDQEASNIRIVNDKNNMIVNLTGKHIEVKKWVLIEDTDIVESISENLEENITND